MGLFDFLFGPRSPQVADPDQLRGLLFEAADDHRRLERLCRTNRQMIVEHFATWQKAPEGLRDDPAAMQRYVQGLVAVAELFAARLDTPELLQRLMGTEQNNPLLRWQNALAQARQLAGELRYPEARDLLTDLLIDVRGLRGSGAETYLPVTLGLLGECYFQGREADNAVPHFEEALRLCEQSGDGEGVVAYLGSLYESHRYQGRAEAAAGYAERLADVLGQQGRSADAARYRRQAQVVRAGEPLNRVVAVVDGVHCELDEVGEVEGKRIQLIFERNRITLHPATELTRRGEELGSTGRHEQARAAFREAGQADPLDPHARYLEGFTLLHLERAAEAVESYEAAEALAPGWFHCRSDLWLARQIALGNLGHEVFVALHMLEDGPQLPADKVRLADQLAARVPGLAPVHLLRGQNLARAGQSQEAEAAYRAGLACAAEPDVKTRLLVELGILAEDLRERAALLREARDLSGNLIAAAQATLALKASAPAA